MCAFKLERAGFQRVARERGLRADQNSVDHRVPAIFGLTASGI
jgi:hypothetical protein